MTPPPGPRGPRLLERLWAALGRAVSDEGLAREARTNQDTADNLDMTLRELIKK